MILRSTSLKFNGVVLRNPFGTRIEKGITTVIGPNGGGKTALANIIERGYNYMTNEIQYPGGCRPRVRTVTFTDIHSISNHEVMYYQQRFESMMNDDVPSVASVLGDMVESERWHQLSCLFGLGDIKDKKINFLSSGELRKTLIIRSLFDTPDLLILDNPFIGLDKDSRAAVESAIAELPRIGTSVMLLVCDQADIPSCTDFVIALSDFTLGESVRPGAERRPQLFDFTLRDDILDEIIGDLHYPADDEPVVELHDIKVAYGARRVLDGIDWTIRRGQCWSLSGRNGSGKSTLLSLINADNPLAYSNDIRLFGHTRGSGESIWEIKARIGYLSSEQHLCFRPGQRTVVEVIEEGFRTAINRFEPVIDAERRTTALWLKYFGIEAYAGQKFSTLSFGLQRLVLLIRALVPNRELLILDEPLHGLDAGHKHKALHAIDRIAATGTTLIYVTHIPEELPAGEFLSFRL